MMVQSDKCEFKSSCLKKIILIAVPIVMCLIIVAIVVIYSLDTNNDDKGENDKNTKETMVDKEKIYDRALALILEKKYETAYDVLIEIKDYPMAQACLEKFEHKIVKDTYIDSEKEVQCTEYEYDENGNCILESKKYDNQREEFIKYTYMNNRCVNEVVLDVYYGEAKIQKNIDYTYNENTGVCLFKNITDYNGIGYDYNRYIYGYDNNKIATEAQIHDIQVEWGSIFAIKNKKIYEYNDKGLVNVEKLYSYDTVINDYVIEYEYDDSGKIVKELYENHSHKKLHEYFYNEKGYIIKKTGGVVDNEESSYVINYEYDADDNLVKEEFENLQESYILEYIYDEYGRLIQKNILHKTPHVSEEIHMYEYEVFYAEEKDDSNKTISNAHVNFDVEKIYAPKIEEYKKAVYMDYESFAKEYENDNLSVSDMLFYFHMYGGSVEYSFYDVDKNGVDELMFSYDNSIIDIYSTDGKEIVELNMPVGERSSLYILSNGILLVEGSDGAESSSMTKYYIDTENDKVEKKLISDIYFDLDDSYDSDYQNYSYKVPASVYCEIFDKLTNMSVYDEIEWSLLK